MKRKLICFCSGIFLPSSMDEIIHIYRHLPLKTSPNLLKQFFNNSIGGQYLLYFQTYPLRGKNRRQERERKINRQSLIKMSLIFYKEKPRKKKLEARQQQGNLFTSWPLSSFLLITKQLFIKKSRIEETQNLSTDADKSNNTFNLYLFFAF